VTPDKGEDDLVSINDGVFDSSVKWRFEYFESSRKLAVLATSKKTMINWLKKAVLNSKQLLSPYFILTKLSNQTHITLI